MYAKDFFAKELKCYKKLQNIIIPGFLGSYTVTCYTVTFDDREHEKDKTVHVLLTRQIKGMRIYRMKAEDVDETTIKSIREQVLDIQERFLEEGIL